MIELKDVKTCIMGIQGSGKSILGKSFCKEFKNPFYTVVNLDDMDDIDKKTYKILMKKRNKAELEEVCKEIIELSKKGLCDALFIDEADMLVPKSVEELQKYPSQYDLYVNHRHYGVAVFFMTRRPQDLNPLVVESCEHKFIFALETSDNVVRKMKSIDYRIPEMMATITKKSHRFIHKQLGETPVLMEAIKLEKKTKNGTKNS